MNIFFIIKNKLRNKLPYFYNAIAHAHYIFNGFLVYRKIKKKYGANKTLFLCPHKATGDVYIFGLYFNTYIKSNKIKDFVFVVVGSDKKIAKMFSITPIESISQNQMDNLIRFSLFVGRKLVKVKILHYRAVCMHMGIIDNLRNYKFLNFVEMLLYIVFKLPKNTPQCLPDFQEDKDYVKHIFQERGLKPHKTVIFSPYSNSIPCIDFDFWENLASELNNLGYTVCTNSLGSTEPVIRGSTSIFFSYENAKTFLEYAGYFVGVRSGLCDIISSFDCKKIVINQPDIRFGVGTVMEYFSLKDMGLNDKITEIEFNRNYKDRIILFILQDICNWKVS